MQKEKHNHGLTIAELLVAASISIIVIGGAFSLWFMTQGAWINERVKSTLLQDLQISIERIKREMQMSDGAKIFFHAAGDGTYDAVSFPIALDDGRSNTGLDSSQDGDGFIEPDSSTLDPITGISKIFWDQTVVYHVYQNGDQEELRRTVFYPRNNALTAAQRQQQVDGVVTAGTGNNASIPEYASWKSTRTLLTAKAISFVISPQLREFDGYNAATAKTEDLIDFGSVILTGGYHTLKFKVTKKNTDSSGYAFGIDALKFTPCGSIIEGESFYGLTHPDGSSGISGSSGETTSAVSMRESPYGVWSNDNYLNYAANEVGDYLTLRFHYDAWCETTFLDGISTNVTREFSNRNGLQDNESGDEEYMLRLEGYDPAWQTYKQVRKSTAVAPDGYESVSDVTYRNILSNKYNESNGMMLRIKFRADETDPLTIRSVYIIQQSGGATDDPYDGSTDMRYTQVTFGGGAASVTVPANSTEWSDWIQMEDNETPANRLPFDKANNYLITFYVPGPTNIVYWEDDDTSDELMSYNRGGEGAAGEKDWPTGLTGELKIYGIEEVFVTYMGDSASGNKGSFISQIFDTGIADPAFTKLQYNAITNSDSSLALKVRSDDNKADLEADADWTGISGISIGANPADISSISGGRYVQFRADFTAIPGPGGATPESYDRSCVVKDVSIYWPGTTTMVDVAGYFTKKPDYGTFTIEVDGQKLTKGFEINLSIEDMATGGTSSRSVTAEIEPRNTGK